MTLRQKIEKVLSQIILTKNELRLSLALSPIYNRTGKVVSYDVCLITACIPGINLEDSLIVEIPDCDILTMEAVHEMRENMPNFSTGLVQALSNEKSNTIEDIASSLSKKIRERALEKLAKNILAKGIDIDEYV